MGYEALIEAALVLTAKLIERGRQTGELSPEKDVELSTKAATIFLKAQWDPPPPPPNIPEEEE